MFVALCRQTGSSSERGGVGSVGGASGPLVERVDSLESADDSLSLNRVNSVSISAAAGGEGGPEGRAWSGIGQGGAVRVGLFTIYIPVCTCTPT